MTVKRENTEIRDQPHEMWAEGMEEATDKPESRDIEYLLNNESFQAFNIRIWFDDMQKYWRWNCDIKRWRP